MSLLMLLFLLVHYFINSDFISDVILNGNEVV